METKTYSFNQQDYQFPANMTVEEVRQMISVNADPSVDEATFTETAEGGVFNLKTGTKG